MTAEPRVLVVLGNLALNGQERGNIEVYRSLAGVGVDALFATHAGWGGRHVQPYLDRLGLSWAPVPYARHFTKRMGVPEAVRNVGRVREGSRAFARIVGEYRPTHVHLANPHYALGVLPALRRLDVPVVYRLGDVPTVHSFYGPLWRRVLTPLVDRFVCISPFVQRAAVASGVPEEKTQVVLSTPPGRPASASDVPADLGDGAGRTVLYVGQVAEHKGVHLLVDAVAALAARGRAFRLLVAGRPSDPAFARALAARALAAGVADRVRFLGYVEGVPSLFAQADLHVCPSICEEALGNVVLEAKRAGVPSVVFPTGGLPDLVVEPGRDGVVCAAPTADALADGLDHYLQMPPDALGDAGAAAAASLARLGADEATFRAGWLRALAEVR